MILSLGEFLWSLLVIFFMVIYFMMLFQVIVDIFRRHDASGGKKALWLLFLLCIPLIGLLAYMITNSESMAQRNVQSVQQSQAEFAVVTSQLATLSALPMTLRMSSSSSISSTRGPTSSSMSSGWVGSRMSSGSQSEPPTAGAQRVLTAQVWQKRTR